MMRKSECVTRTLRRSTGRGPIPGDLCLRNLARGEEDWQGGKVVHTTGPFRTFSSSVARPPTQTEPAMMGPVLTPHALMPRHTPKQWGRSGMLVGLVLAKLRLGQLSGEGKDAS